MDRTQQINLGQAVDSRDGKRLGAVDRLVLNSENQHLEDLVVHRGILSRDKLIDLDLVDQVDGDRVVLNVTADQAEAMPDFVETQFVDVPADALGRYPEPLPSAYGAGTVLYGGPLVGLGYPAGSQAGYLEPIGAAPVVENVRNLPEQDVMIDSGSDVVGADGKKVGTVDRVLVGADGALNGIVVKSGFIFKHALTIPRDWIDEVDDDRILLTVTADAAHAQDG